MVVNYKSIAKKLKFEGRAFINGKYVNAIDGENLRDVADAFKDEFEASISISQNPNITIKMVTFYELQISPIAYTYP